MEDMIPWHEHWAVRWQWWLVILFCFWWNASCWHSQRYNCSPWHSSCLWWRKKSSSWLPWPWVCCNQSGQRSMYGIHCQQETTMWWHRAMNMDSCDIHQSSATLLKWVNETNASQNVSFKVEPWELLSGWQFKRILAYLSIKSVQKKVMTGMGIVNSCLSWPWLALYRILMISSAWSCAGMSSKWATNYPHWPFSLSPSLTFWKRISMMFWWCSTWAATSAMMGSDGANAMTYTGCAGMTYDSQMTCDHKILCLSHSSSKARSQASIRH